MHHAGVVNLLTAGALLPSLRAELRLTHRLMNSPLPRREKRKGWFNSLLSIALPGSAPLARHFSPQESKIQILRTWSDFHLCKLQVRSALQNYSNTDRRISYMTSAWAPVLSGVYLPKPRRNPPPRNSTTEVVISVLPCPVLLSVSVLSV